MRDAKPDREQLTASELLLLRELAAYIHGKLGAVSGRLMDRARSILDAPDPAPRAEPDAQLVKENRRLRKIEAAAWELVDAIGYSMPTDVPLVVLGRWKKLQRALSQTRPPVEPAGSEEPA